jgi:hypothetical protein
MPTLVASRRQPARRHSSGGELSSGRLRRNVVTVTERPHVTVTDMTELVTRAPVRSAPRSSAEAPPRPGSRAPARCLWCGRELAGASGIGRRRRYCAQACRQRAYENRNALERGALPADAVMLTSQERDDLADRLYQVRCAAEDVATALAERAPRGELESLVDELLAAAQSAERIR